MSMPLPDSPTHASLPAADAWLAAADAGDGAATWRTAGATFRDGVEQAQWTAQLGAARGSVGPLTGRRLALATEARDLPGAPPGRYVVLQYHAVYGGRQAVVETLTLVEEADGAWRVVGYFIR